MLQLLITLGFALAMTTGTAVAASPAQETAPYQEDTLQQRLDTWRQRVDAGSSSNPALVPAWQLVEQRWRRLQAATPERRQSIADNLEAALQALENAWQNPPPYFYAIDLATRQHA
jgi:hypothetical protein